MNNGTVFDFSARSIDFDQHERVNDSVIDHAMHGKGGLTIWQQFG
jgi:hypothetical protein